MPTEGRLPSDYMLRALNAALVILFYRRVRNVNPLILQGHVDHVIQALNEFDLALVSHNAQGPGTPWPAFIAGCEAISTTHREALLSWLKKGVSQCGLYSFSMSIDIMKEVWQQEGRSPFGPRASNSPFELRHNSPHYRTWVDVSRAKNMWPMLF